MLETPKESFVEIEDKNHIDDSSLDFGQYTAKRIENLESNSN